MWVARRSASENLLKPDIWRGAVVDYKAVELGPYEVGTLFGRIVHVFVVAAQGHL